MWRFALVLTGCSITCRCSACLSLPCAVAHCRIVCQLPQQLTTLSDINARCKHRYCHCVMIGVIIYVMYDVITNIMYDVITGTCIWRASFPSFNPRLSTPTTHNQHWGVWEGWGLRASARSAAPSTAWLCLLASRTEQKR